MSTTVKLGLGLLVSKGILPKEEMLSVFNTCIEELGYKLNNNILTLNGQSLGKLTIRDRIIINMAQEQAKLYMDQIDNIRSLFAIRSEVAQKNYITKRQEELKRISHDEKSFDKLQKELELEELTMKKAFERQQLESCEALKEELIEAAVNNGYEVEEISNKSSHIQLQLVRREY